MGKRIPKKVSSYLGFFLSVLTNPQKKHFLVYLVGLIWLIKFRSIREIAQAFGERKTDRLHHFLNGSPVEVEALQEANQRWIAQWAKGKEALLILDDTPCPRNGPCIEGLGWHYGAKGPVKGLCAVTAVLKVGTQRLVWAIRGYRPKKACSPGAFQSKVRLAVEILSEAKRHFGRFPLTILMDAWYACAAILNPVRESGWVFLAAIKRNRIVYTDGRKTSVSHLAKGHRKYCSIRISRRQRFRVAKREAYLPKVGYVLVFISRHGNQPRFFVTNDLQMSEADMVRLYRQRYGIDTFHQEIKQHLGFREMFVRSWVAVQKHWTLVGIAYNVITLWNVKRSRSFRQMIRGFRESVPQDVILHLHKQRKSTA
jgi:hypothetical protein